MDLLEPTLLIGLVIGVIAGIAAGTLLRRRSRPNTEPESTGTTAAPTGDRNELIRSYDLTADPAERRALVQQLGQLGVRPLETAGPIDPTVHRVVDVVELDDLPAGAWVGEIVRPGWADADGVLRPADVLAHQRTA